MSARTMDDAAREMMETHPISLPKVNKYGSRCGAINATVHIDKRPDEPLFLVSCSDMADALDISQKALARALDTSAPRIKLGRHNLYSHDGPMECLDLRDWRSVPLASSDLKHKSGIFREVLNTAISQLTQQHPARRPSTPDDEEKDEPMSATPLPEPKAIDLPRPKVFKIVSVDYNSALVLEALRRLDRRIPAKAEIKVIDGEARVEWEESE